MKAEERKVYDSLLYTRKTIDGVIDEYMIEILMRGNISDEGYDRFKERIENIVEERLGFLKNDLNVLQEVSQRDKAV